MFNFIKWLFFRLLSPSAAHYINGGPSLPPPLTPEQEKTLLTRMMAGDAAARDDLITHNLRLVVYLAKKYVLGSDENLVGLQLEQAAERATLRRSVEQLAPRERQIMELRFGLVDGVEHTQKEAADALGISQSYISRLEKRIIRQLKEVLERE